MTNEIWKDVIGYEDLYQVSNLGRVKSLDKTIKVCRSKGKEYQLVVKGRILKSIPIKTGYSQVGLTDKNGKLKVCLLHRLVAQAFIPNPENKPQVNHKDGNGRNNYLSNLEWCTISENGLHAYRILGHKVWHKGKTGKRTPTARKVRQLNLDGSLVKEWDCASDAVRANGFDSGSITHCCRGESKTHKGFIWEYV